MCGVHGKTKLGVIWTQSDREVAEDMVFQYVLEAKANNWWSYTALLIWGPSIRLLAGDADLQAKTRELIKLGVEVKASAEVAKKYGATDVLKEIGVDVQPLGYGLSGLLEDENEEWAILTV